MGGASSASVTPKKDQVVASTETLALVRLIMVRMPVEDAQGARGGT